MSEFEKALEEASMEYQEKVHYGSSQKNNFEAGAHWAREFTVREICEWLESYSKKHDSESAGFFADKIEQHFKDRGGEK